MARKVAKAAAPKAGTKRKAPEPTTVAEGSVEKSETKSLIAQIETSEQECPKASSLKKRVRTEDAAVQKVLHDNFPGFSEEELYINEYAGRSLAQQIRYDRDRVRNGERVTMGKSYYQNLRKLYQSPTSVAGRLRIADESEAEDPDLVMALVAFHSPKKSSDDLTLWCETTHSVNQRMFCGLLRCILKAPPSKSMQNTNLTIAVMTMICRLKLMATYASEVGLMSSHWDAACLKSLTSYKSQGRTGLTWWNANKHWAKLVLPEASADKALHEEQDLGRVAKEIDEVVGSSETGARLLSLAQRQVRYVRVTAIIAQLVNGMKGKRLDMKLIEATKEAFIVTMKSSGADPTARFAPKEMLFEYRRQEIRVTVSSPLDQLQVAIQCYVRTVCVEKGLLRSLWSEDDLVGDKETAHIEIDPDVARCSSVTRQTLAHALDDESATSENISETLRAKNNFLTSADRYWRVEQAFWVSMSGSSIERKVHTLILSLFPKKDQVKTLTEVQAAFVAKEDSKLLAFAGSASQQMYKTAHGYINTMVAGRSPTLDHIGEASFASELHVSLGRLCAHRPAAAADAPEVPPVSFGADAAKLILGELSAKGGASLTFAEVAALLPFTFLVDTAERSKLTKLKNDVLAKCNIKGQNQAEAKTGKPKQSVADTRKAVAAMFAN